MLYYPIQEEHAKLLLGTPVCAVLKDGSESLGILYSVGDGKLVLNGETDRLKSGKTEVKSVKSAKKVRKAKSVKLAAANVKPVKTTAADTAPFTFPEASPFLPPQALLSSFGPKAELELASVELLFPLFS